MESLQRILIVDGYALLVAGLRAVLSQDFDIEVLAGARQRGDRIPGAGEPAPDLLLIDTTMPGAKDMEALAEYKRCYPDARVLIIMRQQSEDFVLARLQAGADGCIRKNASHADIRAAVRSVLQGRAYLDVNIFGDAANASPNDKLPGKHAGGDGLTRRERDVLVLVATGKSSRSIAESLGLSVKTVGKHRANLMAKLDLHNAASLTLYAIERGLLNK